MAADPIQREHQLTAQAFTQGMRDREVDEITDHQELRAVGYAESPVFVLLIGWSFIGSGPVAWRRPDNRFGPLMMIMGFAWFAATLEASNDPLLFSIGRAIASLWIGVFVHALLAFLTGRLETCSARLLVAIYYVDVTVVQLAWLMFVDLEGAPAARNARRTCCWSPTCRRWRRAAHRRAASRGCSP